MNARVAARAEPTEAELRAAYDRSRKAGWPVTFELAMADSFYSKLITLNAKHPPASARQQSAPTAPRHGAARPSSLAQPRRIPPGFDRKRAAAGDRDDD